MADVSQAVVPTIPPRPPKDPKPCPTCSYPVAPPLNANAASIQCSASPSIPAGKHPNFDVDANLADVSAKAALIAKVPDPVARELMRAAVMVNSFYTGRPYDLKNSTKYQSSEQFGNYFYGMVAARMGYSESTAVTAGAMVQQVQNYTYPNHEDFGSVKSLALNIVFAGISGLGDNPGDADQIKAGFVASKNCETTPPPAQPAVNGSMGRGGEGRLGGLNRGWNGGSLFLAPGCYGKCGGSVTITVTPLIKIY